MRSIAVAVLLLAALAVWAPAASACSIAAQPPSERLRGADAAVYGEVVSRTLLSGPEIPGSGNSEYRYRFRVIKTYKGRVGRTTTLLAGTDTGTCEAGLLEVGERHGLLLHGRRAPWRLFTGSFIAKRDLERATRRRG